MKRFKYDIYSKTGVYITTWKDVTNEPQFSATLNAGFSELKVSLARTAFSYGEDWDVAFGNILKLYVMDKESGDAGQLIYSGYISNYEPNSSETGDKVEVTFFSFWAQLAQIMFESAGATQVTYTAQDPAVILKDVLDKFVTAGGVLAYAVGSIDLTGASVTYTFNTNTYQEVLLKIIELLPIGWYLRVGADNIVYLKQEATTPNHLFTFGKDIQTFNPEKRIENLVNTIYFTGAGTLYNKFVSVISVAQYGTHSVKITDTRVTDALTAQSMANRLINLLQDPEVRVVLELIDSNGAENGYDIESIAIGQCCKILNVSNKSENRWDDALAWDINDWDFDPSSAAAILLQIYKVSYSQNSAILEIGNKQPDLAKKIENINRSLIDSMTADNPATPS